MKFCDVIIPIYNAYDATVNCIESVIKNTNLKENRLILINDCSPDERISKHLCLVKSQYPELNIVVIENEKNRGFVGTVNVGMAYSDNDALLLNSDTIVGKDWLDKMRNCAYSQPKVATVTAMSNNATLVSVPQGLMRNEVPDDITIDEYNDMLTKCAYRDYPELPTAHGFCVYIRREVLDKFGSFDEESFGKGYGEENDFSYRCLDHGYKNLLCDDVIVYHLESQSFSEERNKVLEEHLKIIQERYPTYHNYIGYWCSVFPLDCICKNIDYNLNLRKKKNILVLIHEWDNVIGGATIHVKVIVNSLSNYFNFHILFPGENAYILESYFGEKISRVVLPINIQSPMKYNRYNREYGKMVDNIVRAFGISSVHIHHMVNHYFDIGDVIQKYGLNSIITLHDFYSLCPSHNLLYCNEKYCMDMPEKDCAKCLVTTGRASNNIVSEWRSNWNEFLKKFDRVIVPSEDTKTKIQAVYNDINITAIEHGVNSSKTSAKLKVAEKLKVAFIGVICQHKGGDMIRALINSGNPNIEFHAFGKSEFEDLQHSTSNYIFHGPYQRENLSNLLQENNINIICFLQIWPETYSYTINEAVSAGIPVLSLDIGAGAERVKKHKLGWVVPKSTSADDVIEKLVSIKNNENEYDAAVESVKRYAFKTVEEMADEYKFIYDAGDQKVSIDYEALKAMFKEEKKRSNVVVVNHEAQFVLDSILRSAKWRLVNKIKIPKIISHPLKKFLRIVKRIIRR